MTLLYRWSNVLEKFPENNAILPRPKRRRYQDPVETREPLKDTENNDNEHDNNDNADEPELDVIFAVDVFFSMPREATAQLLLVAD